MLLRVEGLKTYFPVKAGLFKKTTGYLKAVDGVSFSIDSGEVVALVGESGCGKSTVGNTLLGLIPPMDGKLTFQDRVIDLKSASSWKRLRKDFQIIFQDPYTSLNPRHTVYEIIAEPMLVHGLCTRRESVKKVEELLAKVGLSPEYKDRFPHAFSGGQRQRLGIARALALNPKLIVCDEIVSALDVSVQAQIIRLLMDLKREFQLSLLFIAHDLSLVRHIADRVLVMYLGRLVETGTAEEIFLKPRHPYTRALLESIPTLDKKRRPKLLKGEVPALSRLPVGCSFYSRCGHRSEKCLAVDPLLTRVPGREEESATSAGGARVACHHPLEDINHA